jgi:hypothetical protein
MRLVSKVAILGALIVPVATVPASAQSWKFDWNVNGGYSVFNKMLDSEDTGLANMDGKDVKFKNGGMLGTQLTFWPSSRIGIRANGTYADRPLEATDFDLSSPASSGLSHVNLWSASGDLLLRLATPREEFTSMELLPYIALGVGAKWHNPAGDNFTCDDSAENKTFACAPFTVPNGNSFALAEANSVMGLAGLGADWRFARNVAIRTEIGDRIWKAKLHAASAPAGTSVALTNSDEKVGSTIHELYGQVGLSFLFGVARPVAVAVAAPPAPVEPAPAPAPAPAPSREAISVCVIDPTAAGGIRMQSAFLVASRDTVVVVNGVDQPLSGSVGNVMVASNADWYVRGQPLTITVGTRKLEYATYGSTRVVEATDLSYLGTVNGVPVYADKNDVADVIGEINDLNRANAGKDLGQILDEQKDLQKAINNVKVLYVPMNATGCVFQAVQLQEEVRKGGK